MLARQPGETITAPTWHDSDAGGVDGQLLSMIQAEPVGDNFEAAAIGDWLVKVHVGHGDIAGDAVASLAANSSNSHFQSRPAGGRMAGGIKVATTQPRVEAGNL